MRCLLRGFGEVESLLRRTLDRGCQPEHDTNDDDKKEHHSDRFPDAHCLRLNERFIVRPRAQYLRFSCGDASLARRTPDERLLFHSSNAVSGMTLKSREEALVVSALAGGFNRPLLHRSIEPAPPVRLCHMAGSDSGERWARTCACSPSARALECELPGSVVRVGERSRSIVRWAEKRGMRLKKIQHKLMAGVPRAVEHASNQSVAGL